MAHACNLKYRQHVSLWHRHGGFCLLLWTCLTSLRCIQAWEGAGSKEAPEHQQLLVTAVPGCVSAKLACIMSNCALTLSSVVV